MVRHLSDESCEMLYETIRNVLNSNLLSPQQMNKLRAKLTSHRGLLRYLSKQDVPTAMKRRRFSQHGSGFLLPILSAAVPLLMNLLQGK